MGLCVLHEGQDLQDILGFTEAMTFPSCRGSAYVTAESGVLKFHRTNLIPNLDYTTRSLCNGGIRERSPMYLKTAVLDSFSTKLPILSVDEVSTFDGLRLRGLKPFVTSDLPLAVGVPS